MEILFVLLVFSHTGLTVRHTLKYLTSESSGLQNFPEFVGAAMIDDVHFGHCDGNCWVTKPTQDWSKKLAEDDPEHLESYTGKCLDFSQIFNAQINKLKKVLKQTKGVHILQYINGCEWDDETGESNSFEHYGYDGEDLVTWYPSTRTWTVSKVYESRVKYETDLDEIHGKDNAFISRCISFLKQYLHYGGSSLQRTDLPSVSLLQKSPSSPVSCFATGFFPKHAVIFWRKDGEELFEDVEHGDILPNHDGSFQMSADLNISLVNTEDWRRYECVFQLTGVKEDIVTKLEKEAIRSNRGPEFPTGLVIGVFVGLLLLSVCITALCIWRKNNNGFPLLNRKQGALEEEAEL